MKQTQTLLWGLPLTAALLLTACGGTPDPQPQPTEQAGQISGQIVPWAVDKAHEVLPVNAAIETPRADFKAPVNAAGQFDLNLPGVSAMTSTYAGDLTTVKAGFAGCTTLTTTAPDTLKIAQINELTTDTQRSLVASSNGGTTFKQWWFASENATFHITGRECLGTVGSFDTDLTLKRGWNVLDVNYNAASNTTSYAVVAAPQGRVDWLDQTQAAASLKVPAHFLRPWVKQ